jgi:hypothetical protein
MTILKSELKHKGFGVFEVDLHKIVEEINRAKIEEDKDITKIKLTLSKTEILGFEMST